MKKSTLWNTLGSAMYGFNSFIMLAVVSIFSSVEETGAFGIAFTTAQLLYTVGLFGVSHYQMTDYKKTYCFSDYAKVRAMSCVLMLLMCVGSIVVLQFSGNKMYFTVFLTILMLLNVVGDLYQNLFFQNNRLDLSGSALFYRTFWSLLCFCLVLAFTRELIWAILIQILCNLLLTLYYIKIASRDFLKSEPTVSCNGSTPRTLIYDCIPLFISLMLMNVVINSSKYGIEFLMDDTAQGYYNMVFMPAQVINLCSQFLFKPMLNQYAVLFEEKKMDRFKVLLFKQIGIVGIFTLVCCIGAYMLGTPILGFLYQKDLTAQTIPLVLVVLGGGIFAICQLCYYIVVIMRKQKLLSYIYASAIVLSVPITYLLVTKEGLTGAALSFALVHVMILMLYGVLLVKSERG